jgi:hypothetical protein
MRVELDEGVIVLEAGLRVKIANFIAVAAAVGPTLDGTWIAYAISDEDQELAP